MRFVLFLLASVCLVAAAQTASPVRGLITDPSGGAVPGATITVSNGSVVASLTKSDAQGRYQTRDLAPGQYTIHIDAPGFARFEATGIQVVAGRRQSLDIALELRTEAQQVTVVSEAGKNLELDPSSNAGARILRGEDLDALSDDRDDLASDLAALAGPAAGPNGGQVFIDGFTGGRLPSKQSIREIRINQDPFSAQYDRPGQGRIEIFTKPGSEDFHGELTFQFSDALFNSRNPFVSVKPDYQKRQYEAEVGGPINKKTSFFTDFERRNIDDNAFINALTLDSSYNVVPFSQAIVTPVYSMEASVKIDRQLSDNHTLAFRYTLGRDGNDNMGIGGQTLPSRAFKIRASDDSFQLRETGVLTPRTINETRFRFRMLRSNQQGDLSSPGITVLDAFSAGGPPLGLSYNDQDHYELHNITSHAAGKHFLRWGGLVRGVSLTDRATQNYAGTFTFTSLESYRRTLIGTQAGQTPAEIRASGGGPSQFTIAGGNPLAGLRQFDFGVFAADDWRVLPNFLLSLGMRYERQTNSGDWKDAAPRIGFAWGLDKGAGKSPRTVIRGGAGVFYDRISENLTLDALRQDGVRQQQFLIPSPDFYPNVPSVAALTLALQPQTVRVTYAGWRAPVLVQEGLGIERQITKSITVASNFLHSNGSHTLRSRNINAPLPASGLRPYPTPNGIYLYETTGVYRQNQWITNVNAKYGPKLSFSGFYVYGRAGSNTDGPGTFPSNQYDLSGEYGRAGFDIRHRFQLNGSVAAPWGFKVSPFVTINSGRPYNITIGRDLNGDGLYNDRPGLVAGAFDLSPVPGETILPRNYADGPGVVSANFRVTKTFAIGERSVKGKKSSDPKEIIVWVSARNILNHPNYAQPVGNLSSPFFGQSTSLLGGGGVAGTRRIDMQIRFAF